MNFRLVLQEIKRNYLLTEQERELTNKLYSEYHNWVKELSKKEKYLIRKYTRNSHDDSKPNRFFERLNRAIRGDYNGKDKDKLLNYGEIISTAIKKHPIEQAIICYRGVDDDLVSHVEIGTHFKFNQFISTSVVEIGALKKKYKYVIFVSEGVIGAYIDEISAFKGQYEFLLDYSCEYKLKAKSGNTIYLEVIT